MPTAGNNGMHQNHTLSLHGLPEKRARILPPTSERIMIYVKQDSELAFTALHLKPPTIQGLILALESKYKINGRSIRHLHRVNRLGHKVKIGNLHNFTQFYSILLKFYSTLLKFWRLFFIIDVSRCWKMELSCANWSTRSPQVLCPNLNKPARHFFSWKMFNLFSKVCDFTKFLLFWNFLWFHEIFLYYN